MRTFFTDDILIFAAGFRPSRTRQPRVTVKKLTVPTDALHALRRIPPVDLIVDLRRPVPTDDVQRATWRMLHPAVAEHGAYIHLDASPTTPDVLRGWARTRSSTMTERARYRPTTDVRRLGDYAIHLMAGPVYLKVPDRRAASLQTRAPELRVDLIDRLPAADIAPTGKIHRNRESSDTAHLDAALHAPAATMRHYQGQLRVLSHMALTHQRTLLPPSFRYPNEQVPTNVLATDIDADYTTLPASTDRAIPRLDGDFFDLTASYHAHFGHFITEIPAKLWGWGVAKAHIPDLRALLRVPRDYQPTYERELLSAYGLSSDDVVWQSEPVEVSSWVACTSLWQNHDPYWFHPAVADVWAQLRRHLIVPHSSQGRQRLFVSRPSGMAHRDCRNAPQVEELFREYGFQVVYPEEHSLAESAALFGGATTVAGFGGSALFNVLFSEHLRTMIILNHEAYLARNEHLYASALGADSHYFWSAPDVRQASAVLDPKAFQSTWDFDFARNERLLRATLEALPESQ
ncbi:glycosyltransferase family 61 protein [Microbacterium protaetiae]|nr:glycosyltransferase family 61 protein [Microbacterium protaetiae]